MRWLQFLPILRSLLLIEPVVSIGVLQWVRYLLRKVESFDEPSRGSWQHERLCQKPLAVNVYCESGTIIIIKYWLNKPTCSDEYWQQDTWLYLMLFLSQDAYAMYVHSAVYAVVRCPSVCFSVRHKPVLHQHGWIKMFSRHVFFDLKTGVWT